MSKDDLKSAYELAMERLRAQDEKSGRASQELTADQKKEIQRLREEARAKLAELEILHRKAVAAAAGEEPEKLAELEEHYRIDRRRVESSLESAVERVRRQE